MELSSATSAVVMLWLDWPTEAATSAWRLSIASAYDRDPTTVMLPGQRIALSALARYVGAALSSCPGPCASGRRTNVQPSATFNSVRRLIGMRRIAIVVISVLLLLGVAVPDSGAGGFRKAISTCPPAGAHMLLSDAQAAIYTIHERLIIFFVGGWA